MWISALSSSSVFPTLPCYKTTTRTPPPPPSKYSGGGSSVGVVECSSRPQKKATAHHMKTRPKKSQPWDIRRKPTVYAPLPSLPPDWTLSEAAAPSLAAEEEDKGGD